MSPQCMHVYSAAPVDHSKWHKTVSPLFANIYIYTILYIQHHTDAKKIWCVNHVYIPWPREDVLLLCKCLGGFSVTRVWCSLQRFWFWVIMDSGIGLLVLSLWFWARVSNVFSRDQWLHPFSRRFFLDFPLLEEICSAMALVTSHCGSRMQTSKTTLDASYVSDIITLCTCATWDLTQAYFRVFPLILDTCDSSFYMNVHQRTPYIAELLRVTLQKLQHLQNWPQVEKLANTKEGLL